MLLYEERLSTAPYTGIRDIDRVPALKLFERLRVSQTQNAVIAYPRMRNNMKASGGHELGKENTTSWLPSAHRKLSRVWVLRNAVNHGRDEGEALQRSETSRQSTL